MKKELSKSMNVLSGHFVLKPLIITQIILFLAPVVFGDTHLNNPQSTINSNDGDLIRIAVMDLSITGNFDLEDDTALNEIFSNAIAETGIFNIAERENIEKVLGEISFQQSGLLDNEDMAEIGELEVAEYLLFGSIGSLFEKIVVSAKMVDVAKGRVVLARTLTTDKERFFGDIDRFALDIASAAVDLNLDVTPDMIEGAIAEQDFPKAKTYLDRYVADQGVDNQVRGFRERIVPNLANSYAEEADIFRKNEKFQEALSMIQQAIALRIDETYISLRDRILREESAHIEEKRIAEEKQKQREEARRLRYERMLEDGQTSLVGAYLANLSVIGHHIGTQNEWPITTDYELPGVFGIWGFEYMAVGDPLGLTADSAQNRGTKRVNKTAYYGVNLQYDNENSGGSNVLKGEIYLSPYSARGFKILNLVLLLAIDAGSGVRFSRDIPGGYDWYLTGGLMSSFELKLKDRMGLFFMVKGKYNWFPAHNDASGPKLRASAGFVL